MEASSSASRLNFFLLWIISLAGVSGLQIHQLVVAPQVVSGSDVILRCLYDVQDTLLYSIKWYKGKHEFYRYLPREKPPAKVFPWTNFQITVDPEEAGKVTLKGVTSQAEGTYKCEVSTEGPFFDTDFRETNLSVLDIRNVGGPVIRLVQQQQPYNHDDKLLLNCTFAKSRPPAQLSWLLNDTPIPPSWYNRYVSQDEDDLKTVGSILKLELSEAHFKLHPSATVSCIASVGSLYQQKSQLRVDEVPARISATSKSTSKSETQLAMAKTASRGEANSIRQTSSRMSVISIQFCISFVAFFHLQ